MNWFKENKFLATWLIVTLIGAAVLGFLMFSARSTYAETQQRYDELSSELSRLQTAAPYPNAENLKKMEALRKEHNSAITDLQKQLAAAEFPLEPTTPEQFQDLLDKSVKRVTTRAMELGVTLPKDKFYMGFDRYERDIPPAEAAPKLGRMLKAMELVVMQLLENRVTELTALKRDPFPEEGGGPAAGAGSPREGTGSSGRGSRDEPAAALVRQPFDIAFIAKEAVFHSFVNAVVTAKTQFFIPKSVTVKNEKQEGPSRHDLTAGAAPPPPPPPPLPPDPNVPPTAPANPNAPALPADPNALPAPPLPGAPATPATPAPPRKFIVGEEKLQISMRIEVVDFPEPTPVAAR